MTSPIIKAIEVYQHKSTSTVLVRTVSGGFQTYISLDVLRGIFDEIRIDYSQLDLAEAKAFLALSEHLNSCKEDTR